LRDHVVDTRDRGAHHEEVDCITTPLDVKDFEEKERNKEAHGDFDLDLSTFLISNFDRPPTDDQSICEIALGDNLTAGHGGYQTPKTNAQALHGRGEGDTIHYPYN
jgi:hypothetical protein